MSNSKKDITNEIIELTESNIKDIIKANRWYDFKLGAPLIKWKAAKAAKNRNTGIVMKDNKIAHPPISIAIEKAR